MRTLNFAIDLYSLDFQPIFAISIRKKAFIILAQFDPYFDYNNRIAYINQVNFKVYDLHNRLNFNIIKKVKFNSRVDPLGPAFFIEVKRSKKFDHNIYRTPCYINNLLKVLYLLT